MLIFDISELKHHINHNANIYELTLALMQFLDPWTIAYGR